MGSYPCDCEQAARAERGGRVGVERAARVPDCAPAAECAARARARRRQLCIAHARYIHLQLTCARTREQLLNALKLLSAARQPYGVLVGVCYGPHVLFRRTCGSECPLHTCGETAAVTETNA